LPKQIFCLKQSKRQKLIIEKFVQRNNQFSEFFEKEGSESKILQRRDDCLRISADKAEKNVNDASPKPSKNSQHSFTSGQMRQRKVKIVGELQERQRRLVIRVKSGEGK
jgi:hypothetical protein